MFRPGWAGGRLFFVRNRRRGPGQRRLLILLTARLLERKQGIRQKVGVLTDLDVLRQFNMMAQIRSGSLLRSQRVQRLQRQLVGGVQRQRVLVAPLCLL